ncbi:bifunctional RNase H/acid phosphatase [Spiractinospora alimapuensis]|nr:bifunctional RNase H/acid phosphatase [Spiractinospora alimapuensis]
MVEADGGSRGNPGVAGYGAVVRRADSGEVLAEAAAPIGTATNNVAEYRGLIAGLACAARVRPGAAVEVRMDSKLVVEQMSGRWRIKHPDLIPLAREAREVATALGAVTYTWIPRARNSAADRLANLAMDGETRDVDTDVGSPEGEDPANAEASVTTTSGPATGGTGWRPPEMVPTRLILLRHGETPLSVERRFAGVGDIELTAVGHGQAEAAARALSTEGIDSIVTSPLRRAHDTASHVAKQTNLDVASVPGLREVDFGKWEGHTFAEVRERWPEDLEAWLGDTACAPPQGESFAEARTRVLAARDELLAHHAGATLLAVSHVTPIKVLVTEALLAPPQALHRLHLDLASICEIHYYADGNAVVVRVNDTAHLRT